MAKITARCELTEICLTADSQGDQMMKKRNSSSKMRISADQEAEIDRRNQEHAFSLHFRRIYSGAQFEPTWINHPKEQALVVDQQMQIS
jgi:hypothetical protein